MWFQRVGFVFFPFYRCVQGASPAAWKAAGRRLAYAQNSSDGVIKDEEVSHYAKSLICFLLSQSSKIRYSRRKEGVQVKKHMTVSIDTAVY